MRISIRWLGVLAAALAAPAAAQDALVLEPSGDWTLDYAEDSCALRRTFGGGESPAWLEIMQLTPGDSYRITIASSGLPMSRRRAPVVRFLPGDAGASYDLSAYGDYGEGFERVAFYAVIQPTTEEGTIEPATTSKGESSGGPALGKVESPGSELAKVEGIVASEASTTAVEVRRAFDPPIMLRIGSLRRPMEAMRACMDDLVAEWELGSIEAQPTPRNMASWARQIQSFFPRGLVQFNGPSRIKVRIIVGPDGKPEKCRVIEPVVNIEYDRRTCGIILEEAEYEPARNAAGEPMRGLHMLDIVYLLSR